MRENRVSKEATLSFIYCHDVEHAGSAVRRKACAVQQLLIVRLGNTLYISEQPNRQYLGRVLLLFVI